MKIILSGGGSGEKTKELDKKFSFLLDKSKPLLYIPIAIDHTKQPYDECLKWLRTTFEHLGVRKYEMWTEKDLDKVKEAEPEDYSGIYIGGGNTPYLLKKLKETKVWDFLKKAINKDLPIYGGSAGAIIFSKTIITSLYYDKNWVEIKDYSGMNVLGGKEITCHYTPTEREKVLRIMKEHKIKTIIALTERNGLFINNEKITVIGKEPAIVFKEEKITLIPPEEKI